MRRFFLYATVLAFTLNTPGSITSAYLDNPPITRVEEDWTLVVASPDVVEEGPQITTCMSPTSDKSSPFVAFDLNYREYPDFQAGGMQVQVWSNDQVLRTSTQHDEQLAEVNETITWTQSMSLTGSQVIYRVKNGNSSTWDDFGGDGNLLVTFATSLTDLSAYSPETSATNSGVTWQSNRVSSLVLTSVRYYAGDILVNTDNNPRTVVSNTSNSNSGMNTTTSAN